VTIYDIFRGNLLRFSLANVIESIGMGSASVKYHLLLLTLEIQICFKIRNFVKNITDTGEYLFVCNFVFCFIHVHCLKCKY
jgi:hypothetical protein